MAAPFRVSLIQGKRVGFDLLACLKILMQQGRNVKGIQGELSASFAETRNKKDS